MKFLAIFVIFSSFLDKLKICICCVCIPIQFPVLNAIGNCLNESVVPYL